MTTVTFLLKVDWNKDRTYFESWTCAENWNHWDMKDMVVYLQRWLFSGRISQTQSVTLQWVCDMMKIYKDVWRAQEQKKPAHQTMYFCSSVRHKPHTDSQKPHHLVKHLPNIGIHLKTVEQQEGLTFPCPLCPCCEVSAVLKIFLGFLATRHDKPSHSILQHLSIRQLPSVLARCHLSNQVQMKQLGF